MRSNIAFVTLPLLAGAFLSDRYTGPVQSHLGKALWSKLVIFSQISKFDKFHCLVLETSIK
jgi:hypothetical protein